MAHAEDLRAPMSSSRSWGRRPNPVFGEEYAELRRILKTARSEAGLSHRSLARRLGRHASHIAKIESGQRRVDVLDLYLLARALGLEPDALFSAIASRFDVVNGLAADDEETVDGKPE